MRRERHFKSVRPYIAMIIALAMVMTSFSTPTVAHADDSVETTQNDEVETVENEATETDEAEDEAEADTIEEEEEIVETEWTVFIYMCGSNLESEYNHASDNLEDLLNAPENDRVRYVIETGGAYKWKNEKIDGDRSQRFVLQNGELECVYDEPLNNMADSGRLCDFIKWGKENYPSKKSMICFWNHGGGISGVCWNDQYDDHLSVPDLVNEFKMSGETFDIIGFDACLMADFDAFSALSPYTDYFVASEEVEPGCGWDYAGYGEYLASNPLCTPKQFAGKLCDLYSDNLINRENSGGYTLSAIDADGLADVKTAVDHMACAISEKITDKNAFTTILELAYTAKHYSYEEEKDLVSLADNLIPIIGEDIAYEVREAVEGAVIHRSQIEEATYNNGISFFWAPQASKYISIYSEFAASDDYLRLIDAIDHKWHGPSRLYEGHDRLPELDPYEYKLEYSTKPSNGPIDSLTITNAIEKVHSISYGISKDTEDGYIIQVAEKGNLKVVGGNVFTPDFDGKVATIGGIPVMMSVVDETPEYTLFNVPVYIQDDTYFLRIAFYPDDEYDLGTNTQTSTGDWIGSYGTEENGKYQIIGIYNGGTSGSNYVARDTIRLENGMEITAAYPEKNEADEVFYRKGGTFTYSAAHTDVATTNIEDGKYYINYTITDSTGKKVSTDYQPVMITDGKLTKYADENPASAETPEEEEIFFHIPCVSYNNYYSGKKTAEEEEKAPAKITALIYLDGCNLEGNGYSSGLIDSMINAKESEDVNLILQTGGCDSWNNDAIKNDKIQRFEVHEGTLVEVECLDRANFGAGYTLESFLKWGAENYPAEKNIFITYDHGGAWMGNSSDDAYDDSLISLLEMEEALKNSGIHFDLIYFDCCLMATAEVCAGLAPYADYMIGAEECVYVTPIVDQKEMYSYLARHVNDFDVEKYGKFVVNDLVNRLDDMLTGQVFSDYQDLSFIDLRKMDNVIDSINELGKAMTKLKSNPAKMAKLTRNLDDSRSYKYKFQRDIADFANHAAGVDADSINNVINAVDEAVVYFRATNNYAKSCGMAICYPTLVQRKSLDEYSRICPFKDYLAFMDSIILDWHPYPDVYEDGAAAESVNVLDYKIDYDFIQVDDDSVAVKINSDLDRINGYYYSISAVDPDGYRFHEVSCLGDFYGTEDDDSVFIPGFDGRALTINGCNCYAYVYQEKEDGVILGIPAYLGGSNVEMLVECKTIKTDGEEEDHEFLGCIDFDNCTFEYIGVILDGDLLTGLPSRDVIELEEGEELTLINYQTNSEGETIYSSEGDTITYSDDMDIKFNNLPDGEYRLQFVFKDGLMHEQTSDGISVVIKNGRIQSETIPETEEEEEPEEEDVTAQIIDTVDNADLKYNVSDEDASLVYFVVGADEEDAQSLADAGISVTKFGSDDDLGFLGSVAAYCIDYDELLKDAKEATADDSDENGIELTETEGDAEEAEESEDDAEEVADAEDDDETIYANYIEGIGLLASLDPVALDQACLDIISQFDLGRELIYNVMECHGVELLETAEEVGCGMRHYRLEFNSCFAE